MITCVVRSVRRPLFKAAVVSFDPVVCVLLDVVLGRRTTSSRTRVQTR